MGQDTVGAGTFWGVLNVFSLCLRHSARIGPDLTLFVADTGSQLTLEMGERGGAEISKNVTNAGSQLSRASLTEVQNRKGAESGLVTTDLLDV